MPSRARLVEAYIGVIYMSPSLHNRARENIGKWSDETLMQKFKEAANRRRRAKDWVENVDKNLAMDYNCDI